ncbi:MAG: TetR/AcrR family transcriptional regulator [Clostridiales bacterium]|nr:TetR/AcrR family transcriptional regulator [Clostridiales bacterium]
MARGLTNTPKTARGLTTMNRIIRAAEVEFGRKGYHYTGINDIAQRAKVASGTIYLYFSDKYSLYVYLLTQYGERIRRDIAKNTKDLTDRGEIERMGLLSFLKLVKKQPHMYNIIWESLHINPKLFIDYYETFARRYKAQLDHAQGDITPMDNMVMAYALMGIANFVGLKYVFFDKKADLEYVVDEVMKIYRHGILGAGSGKTE